MLSAPTIYKKKEDVPHGARLVDTRVRALQELYSIRNPKGQKGSPEYLTAQTQFAQESTTPSVFVYYAWAHTVVETLPEEEYFELRTARNRHMITTEEQQQYRHGRVAIAGLSVGSAILHALVMSGGPRRIKIADFDVVEITNLNRLQANLIQVGEAKTVVAAKRVWEIDPYADLELFDHGVTVENAENFLLAPRVDILIDEMESLDQKVRLRLIAKREGIPVLMATDNGNGVVLDVERFDKEPSRPIFHGLTGFNDVAQLKDLTFRDWLTLATKIVGPEFLGERMRKSILAIGHTIPSVPQLGTSALFAGTTIAFAVRTILTQQPLLSGRYTFTLEQLFDREYNSEEEQRLRGDSVNEFLQQLQSRL